MLDVANALLESSQLSTEEAKGLQIWKANLLASTIGPHVKKQFVKDFWAWLLGRGTEEDVKKTPWGRQSLADDPEVEQYVSMFPTKMQEYRVKLFLLASRRPLGINECYLYYKYIVRGELPRDASGYVVFTPEFLKDWDAFGRDFDTARKQGQEYRRPKGSAHEMAPYGDVQEQVAKTRESSNQTPSLHGFNRKGGADPRDADSDSSSESSTEEEEDKVPVTKERQEKVKRVHDPDAAGVHEDISSAAARLAEAMGPLIRQSVINEGAANVRGQQEQFQRQAETRIQTLERQLAEQENKYREQADIARRAGLPEPPQPESGELRKEAEALRGMVKEGQLLLEEARKAEAARELAIVTGTKEGLASIERAVSSIAQGAKANASDVAQLSTTVQAIGTVLQGVRTEMANIQSAYTANFATTQEFIQRMQQQHTTAAEVMKGLQSAQEKVPLLLEGFRQAEEAKRLEITTLVQQRVAENANDPQQLAEILRQHQTKTDMEANKRLVMDFASNLMHSATGEGATEFLQTLTGLQSRLAREAAGLSYDDAARAISELGAANIAFMQSREQAERARRVQEATVAESLRLTGAQQVALLENQQDSLRATQIQTLELTLQQKNAEIQATEARAKQQAMAMEAARQESAQLKAALTQMERNARIAEQNAARLAEANRNGYRQLEAVRSQAGQIVQQTQQQLQQTQAMAAEELRATLKAAKDTEARVFLDFERLREAGRAEQRQRQLLEQTLQEERKQFAARMAAFERERGINAGVQAIGFSTPAEPRESDLEESILKITAAHEQENKRLAEEREAALARLQKSYNRHRNIYIRQGYNELPPLNVKWTEDEIRDLMDTAKVAMQERQNATFNATEEERSKKKREAPKEKEETRGEEEQKKKSKE